MLRYVTLNHLDLNWNSEDEAPDVHQHQQHHHHHLQQQQQQWLVHLTAESTDCCLLVGLSRCVWNEVRCLYYQSESLQFCDGHC